MNEDELKWIIEALLVSSEQPLDLEKLTLAFEEENRPDKDLIKKALASLEKDYLPRAIELKQVASGYCLQTKASFAPWIHRLQANKPLKYSRALLETIAIIAYEQPITRPNIEAIRGVSVSSSILKTLIDREWIKIAGYKDIPGKPAIYVTTRSFLDYFNLKTLAELPPLEQNT